MIILDGNKLSKKILEDIAKEIKKRHLLLRLAVVLVGDNSVSRSYTTKKQQACEAVGIDFKLFNFPSDIDDSEFKKEIKKIVDDKSISGVVIQLPLPPKFDTSEILNFIPADKDIDVLSSANFEKFSKNELPILPPVVGAIKRLFEEYKISIKNKKITLIGRGRLVGRPLSVWLENNKIKFFLADKKTEDISKFTKESDIIISGAGCGGLIKEDMVKRGAVLVDVGTSSEEGKVKGDIDPSSYQKSSYVAPVPGGVGPMTVAILVENLLKLNCAKNAKK